MDEILDLIESVSDSFPTYSYYPRAPDHTSVWGAMSVYQIFQNCRCLNDALYENDLFQFQRLTQKKKYNTFSNKMRCHNE